MIADVYAALARRRREWYAARPASRRRLRRPVVSIGNIAAGGRGKTPFTAAVARVLLDLGERPAILSRGYARTRPYDRVVVVRDAAGMRADLARAGDEPLMLARQLPGAIVVTSPDRYAGGTLAEETLGATVHLLDDGFQHVQLDRDIDIVLVAGSDLTGRTFPTGRLREPPDVLVAADAIVVIDGAEVTVGDIPVFGARRRTADAVFDPPAGASKTDPVFAVCGIAQPAGFLDAVTRAGWRLAGSRVYRDHHPFSRRDAAEIAAAARAAGASAVLTTEKDYVRLLPHRPFALPVGWLPLTMEPDPPAVFRRWLESSMASARDIVLD